MVFSCLNHLHILGYQWLSMLINGYQWFKISGFQWFWVFSTTFISSVISGRSAKVGTQMGQVWELFWCKNYLRKIAIGEKMEMRWELLAKDHRWGENGDETRIICWGENGDEARIIFKSSPLGRSWQAALAQSEQCHARRWCCSMGPTWDTLSMEIWNLVKLQKLNHCIKGVPTDLSILSKGR